MSIECCTEGCTECFTMCSTTLYYTECSTECFTICCTLYSTECFTWSFYHSGRRASCWSGTQMRPDLMRPPSASCPRRSTSCHATGAFDFESIPAHLCHQMGLTAGAQIIHWSKNKKSMFSLLSGLWQWTFKTTLNRTCRTPSSAISCQWGLVIVHGHIGWIADACV